MIPTLLLVAFVLSVVAAVIGCTWQWFSALRRDARLWRACVRLDAQVASFTVHWGKANTIADYEQRIH